MSYENHNCEVCNKRLRNHKYFSHSKCNTWGIALILCSDCIEWVRYLSSYRMYKELVTHRAWERRMKKLTKRLR